MTKEFAWYAEVDVAIVGFGAAGACAALQALEQGSSVAIFDRNMGGGATAISGGIVYAGGGTHIQHQAGVEDNVDEMFNYLSQEVKDVVSPATLRTFCETSADNLKWLEKYGVEFEASLCPYKTSYPLDKYCLYYSGNEPALPYRNHAIPAQRGHRVKGKGMPGQRFYAPLQQSVHNQGAHVFYQSTVEELIQDEHGKITGLQFKQIPPGSLASFKHRWYESLAIKINNYLPQLAKALRKRAKHLELRYAQHRCIKVNNGVILSAGGFIYNRPMVQQYAPAYRPGMPLGTSGCNGSGIQMGHSIGGQLQHMQRVSAWRFINPPQAFTRGVLLNRQGKRYINEELYGATIGEAMVEHNNGEAILIIDETLKKLARTQVGHGKAQWFQTAPAILNLWFNCRKANSIAELARNCRMPEKVLNQTLNDYVENAEAKHQDPFGKSRDGCHVLRPPYYAINCSIDSNRFPCPTLTLGGLVVDETTGQVRHTDGQLIDGLYAAGRTAVGICSQQYVSGLSIADCIFSGRRAGRASSTAGGRHFQPHSKSA